MKRLQGIIFVVLSTVAAWCSAAPVPRYENFDTVTFPPQVDAVEFINHGVFDLFTVHPFDTQNTLYYTNRGSMFGSVGYRFDYSDGSIAPRGMAASFHNRGLIQSSESFSSSGQLEYLLIAGATIGSYIDIKATNVVSTGVMGVGPLGVLSIEGRHVDLSRSGIVAGTGLGATLGSPFTLFLGGEPPNYINPGGINENYWGVGVNGVLDPQQAGIPMDLAGVSTPNSGPHQVVVATSFQGFTNFVSIPSPAFLADNGFGGFAYTNAVSPTNLVVQVVFVPTNFPPDTSVAVRFSDPDNIPAIPGTKTVLVELGLKDIDAVTALPITNLVYVIDRHCATTNATLAFNLFTTNFARPDVIDFALATPPLWLGGTPTNAVYAPELIAHPQSLSPQVTNYYAAVSVSIGTASRVTAAPGGGGGGGFFPGVSSYLNLIENAVFGGPNAGYLTDPTNRPARIEITADSLDLYQTRLKSDGMMSVRAKHFTGRSPARTDAPYFQFDLGSTNPSVVISNVVPFSVRRLTGDIACWSSVATNLLGIPGPDPNDPTLMVTNTVEVRTHVLIVDTSGLGTEQLVETIDANFTANRVEFFDTLRITRSILINAESFRNAGDINMVRPRSIVDSQFPRLKEFENEGTVVAGDGFHFGTDRITTNGFGVLRVNNSGAISSATVGLAAGEFENSGIIAASTGVISLQVGHLKMDGGSLAARSDVVIQANDFKGRTNSIESGGFDLDTATGRLTWYPGTLVLDVTTNLTDGGVDAANEWTCHDGFRLVKKPMEGDLLGTSIRSLVNRFGEAVHTWAAEDRGATAEGYRNNAALGRLILEGNFQGVFTFAPVGASNALYVDFLEFVADATNIVEALSIQPGFRIYFRDSNLAPADLETQFPGQLVHASGVVLGGGFTTSAVPATFRLHLEAAASAAGGGTSAGSLAWAGLPGGRYVVEYTSDLAAGPWLPLGETVNGPSRRVSMQVPAESLPKSGSVFFRAIRKP